MWVMIKCPACQTSGSASRSSASYKGRYRCWKCRALFAIEVKDGEMVSHRPITEAETEQAKAGEEAENKGLPDTRPPAAPPAPVKPFVASPEPPKAPIDSSLPKSDGIVFSPTKPAPRAEQVKPSAASTEPAKGPVDSSLPKSDGIVFSSAKPAPKPETVKPSVASTEPAKAPVDSSLPKSEGIVFSSAKPAPRAEQVKPSAASTEPAKGPVDSSLPKSEGIVFSPAKSAPKPEQVKPSVASTEPLKTPAAPALPKSKPGAAASPPNPAAKPPEPKAEAPGMSGKTVKIDGVNTGFIVVGGKQYVYDVVILPDGRVIEREPGRGRIGSHSITDGQLEPAKRMNPEVIIVGTGMREKAKLSEQRASNIDIRVMSSPEAVKEFNKLAAEGKRVAALIHVTC